MIVELETDLKVTDDEILRWFVLSKIFLISSGFESPEDYFRLCFSIGGKKLVEWLMTLLSSH